MLPILYISFSYASVSACMCIYRFVLFSTLASYMHVCVLFRGTRFSLLMMKAIWLTVFPKCKPVFAAFRGVCYKMAALRFHLPSLVPSPLPAAIFNGARKVVWHI